MLLCLWRPCWYEESKEKQKLCRPCDSGSVRSGSLNLALQQTGPVYMLKMKPPCFIWNHVLVFSDGVSIARRFSSASLVFTKQLITCQTVAAWTPRQCLKSRGHNPPLTRSRHSLPFLLRDQEIIIPVYLSPRRRCHSQISVGTLGASVGGRTSQRLRSSGAPDYLKERLPLRTQVYENFL